MASSLATFGFAVKQRFDVAKRVEDLTMAERPLLAHLSKDTSFAGDGTIFPLIYGRPQGQAGNTVAQSQTSSTNLTGKKFIVTAGDYFGTVSVGDKIIKTSRSNPGAFLKNSTPCSSLLGQASALPRAAADTPSNPR